MSHDAELERVHDMTGGPVSFVSRRAATHGKTRVKIIHGAGTDSENVVEVDALIQAESGFFDVNTPIYEGDLVEMPDPRGGSDRRTAAKVNMNNFGSPIMHHIEVKWGKSPAHRIAPVKRLTFENLHESVQSAGGLLFADGQYAAAVSEGFKSIEVRVRELTGSTKSGAQLMADAFNSQSPKIDVAMEDGRSGQDEREGFLHLFRGAMIGIRNPKAHELFKELDPQAALEYLGFASLLHRRIDKRKQRGES